jgi:hypothetical protein
MFVKGVDALYGGVRSSDRNKWENEPTAERIGPSHRTTSVQETEMRHGQGYHAHTNKRLAARKRRLEKILPWFDVGEKGCQQECLKTLNACGIPRA